MALNIEVFVSTYRTYNNERGSLGQWFELSNYENLAGFEAAAVNFANDVLKDDDPELMYLDISADKGYQLIKRFISEDYIDPQTWEVMALDEDEIEPLEAFLDARGEGQPQPLEISDLIEQAQNDFFGYFKTREEFAAEYLEQYYAEELAAAPSLFISNLNMAHVYEDIRHDFFESNGYYFHA